MSLAHCPGHNSSLFFCSLLGPPTNDELWTLILETPQLSLWSRMARPLL